MKKISCILPTYNGERYLMNSIESVLNQTYKNFELIIIDDCSKDKSYHVAKEYAKKDKRIKVIKNKTNLKLPQSLNIGFKNSTGEYLTWTSDDNVFHSNAFERMAEYLNNEINCDLVSFDFNLTDENLNVIRKYSQGIGKRTPFQLAYKCNVGACFMYRRKVYEQIGEYNPKMFCAEDYEYWCRIALNNNIHYVDEILYEYRNNPYSLTSTKKDLVKEKTLQIRLKYAPLLLKKYGYKYRINEMLYMKFDYIKIKLKNFLRKLK